jgi:hypothetical protein
MTYSVDSIKVDRLWQNEIISASVSGTYSLDLSQGNTFKLKLTGNTVLQYTNAKKTTYQFIVDLGPYDLNFNGNWLLPDGEIVIDKLNALFSGVFDGQDMWLSGRGIGYATDFDAFNYIQRVEAADNQTLELPVKIAIQDFFICLKNEGIFNDIKTGCLLVGPRTINGALEPIVGNNTPTTTFTSSDYNRKTGIKGDSSKIINSGRPANSDPQNDHHLAVWVSVISSLDIQSCFIGAGDGTDSGTSHILSDTRTSSNDRFIIRLRSSTISFNTNGSVSARNYLGFVGTSRDGSTSLSARVGFTNFTATTTSQTPLTTNTVIFSRGNPTTPTLITDAGLSFYSIGVSTNLTKLESCIQSYMTAIDGIL